MPESKPEYLVWYCPGCIAIRHLRLKEAGIYHCLVCGMDFDYIDGRINSRKGRQTTASHDERTIRG